MAGRRTGVAPAVAPRRPRADRARELLADRSTVAGMLPATAAVALLLMLPAGHWSAPAFAGLVGGTSMAALFAVVNIWSGRRGNLPLWWLHLEIGIGNVAVSGVVAITASQNINMGNLYLLTATVAVLLFSVRAALAHVGAAGVCYAAVLAFEPATAGPPVVAWLAVFGTIGVVGAVVIGLVSVLHLAATADPLTGLPNRRAWDERLDEEMERSMRIGTALSVVVIDLDGFKDVNDRDGHAAGDHLLQSIAKAWGAQVRSGGDFLARIGGDEFAVIAPDSGQLGVRRLIQRFARAAPTETSFSAGAATWDQTERASDLLHRADVDMYETKLKHRRARHPHSA